MTQWGEEAPERRMEQKQMKKGKKGEKGRRGDGKGLECGAMSLLDREKYWGTRKRRK